MGPLADPQIVLHPDPGVPELVNLADQRGRIDDDPVADNAQDVLAQDAGGDVVQGEAPAPGADGVAGVGPATIARHDVGPLGQEVDDLPLSLVAPLRADHDKARHHLPEEMQLNQRYRLMLAEIRRLRAAGDQPAGSLPVPFLLC